MKRKPHKINLVQLALTLILAIMTATVWAWSGSGTSGDPYLITSTSDWNTLASNVNSGNNYSGKFFRLTNDISVETMVGNSESNSFRGTFDGYGHTLNITLSNSSNYTAPFRYIQGATFKNLKVTGSITTTMNFAAGIAGLNTSAAATFDQCRTDVTINSSSTTGTDWGTYDYHGALLARTNSADVNITDCVCGGSVDGSSSAKSYCACFVGVAVSSTVSATRCLSTTIFTNVYDSNSLCHSASATRLADVLYYVDANEAHVGTQVTPSQLADGSYATALQAGRTTTIWVQQSSINQPMLNLFAFNKASDGYYLIGSEQEWRNFASLIQTIPTANGRLTANISVTTMMGSGDKPFSGIFDGNGHTLTVAYNTTEEMTGPFRYTRGATIMNLHTAGTIITSAKFAGGLIGFAREANTITNCRSSVYITSSVEGDGTHGGFIGDNEGSTTVTSTFEGCVFEGKLLGSNTNCCGGFVGWCNGNVRLSLTNCLYAPQEVTIGASGSQTFSRTSNTNNISTTNCYYSQLFGGEQGKQRYKILAATNITINGLGTSTATYNVSGITAYSHGIKYNELYYAGASESVSLNLSHTSHAGYDYRYSVTSGSLANPTTNTPTLTMPASVVIIQVSYSASKSITGYSSDENGWYLISSPMVENQNPSSVTNMTANTYDLFRFNQNAEMEWQNYKTHNNDAQNPFNALASGQGYLYANSGNVTLTFVGTPYSGDGVVNLEYSTTNPDSRIHGWNLIGNPFGTTATIGATPFYKMNGTHTEIIAAADDNIDPMEGIFVRATGSGQSVTFTTGGSKGGERNSDNLIINLERNNSTGSNSTIIDRAIVSFDEGYTLEKFQIDENNTKLYIPQNGEDYAIAFSDRTGELPLHFIAKETGKYTITVETNDRASLHGIQLIDRFEDVIINLNENNKYTFIGSPSDNRDRFVIRFENSEDSENSIFAYQSGNDIIVNGEGELQMFDVMGRLVSKQQINGVETVRKPSQSGVYIFRLNGKSQKIVIK